jgi:nicotinamide-nucleotide amidase
VKAEIIAVGTELLMGETADTNSNWLAIRMPEVGLDLRWITVVGDDMGRLTELLERAWGRSDYVFTIGGLGPTEDDMTRDAIASMLGEPLTTAPGLIEWLEESFRSRGIAMPAHNRRQAGIIPSAEPVLNPMGTAPGWWVERDDHVLVTMPGPPGELHEMWSSRVGPRLKERITGSIIRTRTFKTIGLSEAALDEMVKHLYGQEEVDLGCYTRSDGISLRAITKAPDESTALRRLDAIGDQMRAVLGPHLWGLDDDRPERRLAELLRNHGYKLAVVESCTGGLLAGAITEVPGSSEYFVGGAVTYTNQLKIAVGVDPAIIERYGAVSEKCALAMAQAARATYGADCGIGVTGVAGPSQQDGVPVGTVYIGVAHPGGESVSYHRFPPRRPLVRGRAVLMALLDMGHALQQNAG